MLSVPSTHGCVRQVRHIGWPPHVSTAVCKPVWLARAAQQPPTEQQQQQQQPPDGRMFSNLNRDLKHDPGSVFGSAMLVAGTTIGAGERQQRGCEL